MCRAHKLESFEFPARRSDENLSKPRWIRPQPVKFFTLVSFSSFRNRWSSPTRPRRIHFGGFDLSLLKFDPESSGGAWRSPLTLMAVAVDSVRVNRISNSEGPSEHKATFKDEWAWQYYSLPTV
ncbi:hypothetical protein ACFX2I_038052 [Malus domestica]